MNTKNSDREAQAQSLFAAYRNGDETAFLALYDMYAGMLLNYGACITTDKELVKDWVQDVFVKFINKKDELQISKITSYLIISLRNRLLDEFRRNNYMTESAIEDCKLSYRVSDVETEYMSEEHTQMNNNKVMVLMQVLTPRQREAFTLYYLEQRKYDEICDIMHMSYPSVRNLVHRGMIKLREAAV